MADAAHLSWLQQNLNACLLVLQTANAGDAVIIRQNIYNLRREIDCLLNIINFQLDAHSDRKLMPPPSNLKF